MEKIIQWIGEHCDFRYPNMRQGALPHEEVEELESLIRKEFPGLNEVRDMLHKLCHARFNKPGAHETKLCLKIWDIGTAFLVDVNANVLLTVEPGDDLTETFKDFVDAQLKAAHWRADVAELASYCRRSGASEAPRAALDRLVKTLETFTATLAAKEPTRQQTKEVHHGRAALWRGATVKETQETPTQEPT